RIVTLGRGAPPRGGVECRAMPPTLLVLPPITPTVRDWATRLAAAVPALHVVVAEEEAAAAKSIGEAEAAFGTISPVLLRRAARLRWLQAPQAAPPAGYYFGDLIAHPVVVTNFREIYNDHIAAHIMAFVLAFARGLHHYLPQQHRGEWLARALANGGIHRPQRRAHNGLRPGLRARAPPLPAPAASGRVAAAAARYRGDPSARGHRP